MKKNQEKHSDEGSKESLHSNDFIQSKYIQIDGSHIWHNKRFIQMWDTVRGIFSTCLSVFLIIILIQISDTFHIANSTSPVSLFSFRFFIFSALSFISFFAFYMIFQKSSLGSELVKRQTLFNVISSEEYDPPSLHDKTTSHYRKIIQQSLCCYDSSSDRCNGIVHYIHDKLAGSGLLDSTISLLVDECRYRKLWFHKSYPSLDSIVLRFQKNGSCDTERQKTIPLKLSYSSRALYAFGYAFSMLLFASTAYYPLLILNLSTVDASTAVVFGTTIGGASLLIYIGLRELGFLPLPLWRGECSIEETRVCNFFRWRTFKPGRDLAIVRFTSDNEADIAFIGADGSHATARAGGKYLEHFIACWALSPDTKPE